MNKPKIAMVAPPIHPVPPRYGAAVEWWMYQVGLRLQQVEPWIFSIQAPGYSRYEQTGALRIERIAMGRLYKRLFQKWTRWDPCSYAWRVARVIRQQGIEQVHVHNSPALLTALYRQLGNGYRYILHLHNEMEVTALPEQVLLLTVSEYLAAWYRQRLPGVRVEVLTNGVDLQLASHPQPWPQSLQVAETPAFLLYGGRISPEKGPLELAQAVLALQAELPAAPRLLIAGGFSEGKATNKRVAYGLALKQLAAQHPQQVQLLGSLSPEQMYALYQRASLTIVPSIFEEPLCMVALEAMASGSPVLVSPRGGMPEYVRDGHTGYLLPAEVNSAAWATRIREVLADPRRLQVAAQGQAYVQAQHSWSLVSEALSRFYLEAAG